MAFSIVSVSPGQHHTLRRFTLADMSAKSSKSFTSPWDSNPVDPASGPYLYNSDYASKSHDPTYKAAADNSGTASASATVSPTPSPTPTPTPSPTPSPTPKHSPAAAAAVQPDPPSKSGTKLAFSASDIGSALGQVYRSAGDSIHSGLGFLNNLSPSSLYNHHGFNPTVTKTVYLISGILALAGTSMVAFGSFKKK